MSNVVLLKYALMLLMLSIYYKLLVYRILPHVSDIMSMFLPMPHVDSQLSCAGEYLLSCFECRLTVMELYNIHY